MQFSYCTFSPYFGPFKNWFTTHLERIRNRAVLNIFSPISSKLKSVVVRMYRKNVSILTTCTAKIWHFHRRRLLHMQHPRRSFVLLTRSFNKIHFRPTTQTRDRKLNYRPLPFYFHSQLYEHLQLFKFYPRYF